MMQCAMLMLHVGSEMPGVGSIECVNDVHDVVGAWHLTGIVLPVSLLFEIGRVTCQYAFWNCMKTHQQCLQMQNNSRVHLMPLSHSW